MIIWHPRHTVIVCTCTGDHVVGAPTIPWGTCSPRHHPMCTHDMVMAPTIWSWHTRYGRGTHGMVVAHPMCTHDMVMTPTIWSWHTRHTVLVHTTYSCYTRHGHVPHDMNGTHDMVRPCRVVHITMSCGTCTTRHGRGPHDMVVFPTTWSRATRHDHIVCNIYYVPHGMVKIPHGMPTRRGHASHDMVTHPTTCYTRYDHVVCASDHTVCAPCRVGRLTIPCGVLGLPMHTIVWIFCFDFQYIIKY